MNVPQGEPDPGAPERQHGEQRRWSRRTIIVASAVAAAIGLVALAIALIARPGETAATRGANASTAAITSRSVAAAVPEAAKQRVQIDMKFSDSPKKRTFVLTGLEAGELERDSGTHDHCGGGDAFEMGEVLRDGQQAYPWVCPAWVFTGRRGTLVLRSEFVFVEVGGPYNIATGTWKVVRGTGQYARISGGGRIALLGCHPSCGSVPRARYQGFLTSP